MSEITKTAEKYRKWLAGRPLTRGVAKQAEKVRLSFGTLHMNKNNAAALETAQRMHDADMAKLEKMMGDKE